jgi:DNA repair protein RadD
MFNVGVFTTGFDVPELDCIVMARPTMSLALYYQMIGRGVRLDPMTPDKILQVYDLVGVVETLGRVETIRVHREKRVALETKFGLSTGEWMLVSYTVL